MKSKVLKVDAEDEEEESSSGEDEDASSECSDDEEESDHMTDAERRKAKAKARIEVTLLYNTKFQIPSGVIGSSYVESASCFRQWWSDIRAPLF